jgi:cobalamin biosynthetic protein CobC
MTIQNNITLPAHGGDLVWAAHTFGRPIHDWLDLSTAISPWLYPVPKVIPDKVWQRLPYDHQDLLTAAEQYYGCCHDKTHSTIIPVNGSQQAIQALPHVLSPTTVAIPAIAYKEHALAWERAGHAVYFYHTVEELQQQINDQLVKHVVVVNPNNPTGEQWTKKTLIGLRQQLLADAYLVVDEAFMDVHDQHSVSACSAMSNTVVLRSLGKFFGLAGVRLGFAIVHGEHEKQHDIIHALQGINHPWGVNHIALWIGEIALRDTIWQTQQRQRIHTQQRSVQACLEELSIGCYTGCGLLNTLMGEKVALYDVFMMAAKAGILLRYEVIDEQTAWLRVGLPNHTQWVRLRAFFDEYCHRHQDKSNHNQQVCI